MPRRLLNIASIVCLVACVALLGMWVGTYSRALEVRGRLWEPRAFIVAFGYGRIYIIGCELVVNPFLLPFREMWPWSIKSVSPFVINGTPIRRYVESYGTFSIVRSESAEQFPCWLLVLVSGSLAMIFRLRWPWRFTLRSLFIAMTFLAVVLGTIAWLGRAWIGK